MRYLIDTNVFIDYIEDRPVQKDVLYILEDSDNTVYVSSESIKEFIHLMQSGKILCKKNNNLMLDVFDIIENELGFNIKYVAREHLRTLAKLEAVEGHTDPSDRLIIAQAITEKMPLVSSDRKFPKYRKFGLDFIPNW
jgi:PIN domain nuclease of toxin-antitoxin system